MYKSKSYYDLDTLELKKFIDFLESIKYEKNQPAYINMIPSNSNNTLLYILNHTDRFINHGMFQILYFGTEIIGCSGAYQSPFSSDICILGTRTWIRKDYRNKNIAKDYLLPKEKKWAIRKNYKCIALTFNEYNKNIIKTFSRMRLGEKRTRREKRHFGFGNLHTLEFPVNINYTKQWIIFELLDNNFNYDWQLIEWVS